jgi:hypothetical protein
MSKPTLADLPARYQAQVAAQLKTTPHPRTVSVERDEADAIEPDAARFMALLDKLGMARPVQEHRFDGVRRWRFDYAWPVQKVALEVEGGVWTGGRHTRGAGFVADMEKYNAATVQGWRVLRCTPDTLCAAATLANLRMLLK